MLYRVKRYCCCGYSLRTGTVIIGCYELIRDIIITLIISLVFLHRHTYNRHWDRDRNRHRNNRWNENWSGRHRNHSSKGYYVQSGTYHKWTSNEDWRTIYCVLLSYFVIGILSNAVLLLGVMKKPTFIKIYLIANISAVVIFSVTFISLIIAFGLVSDTLFPRHNFGYFILCIICIGIEVCFQSYNVLVVNSYRLQMKNDQGSPGSQVPQYGSKPPKDDLESPSKQEYDSKMPQDTLQVQSKQEYDWFNRHGKS